MTTEYIGVAYRITAVVIKTTSTVDMNEWDVCGNNASTISISCNFPCYLIDGYPSREWILTFPFNTTSF